MPILYLALAVVLLLIALQLGVFGLVLSKLGLSPDSASLLLFSTLLGSLINLRLFTIDAPGMKLADNLTIPKQLLKTAPVVEGKIVILLNVGGALIPVAFSLYLLTLYQVPLPQLLSAIFAVALVSYLGSRPVKGVGIGIPVFIPPVTAALAAILLAPGYSAVIAYVSGTLGVLIGADLLRIKDIKKLGVPFASIGGAGTFDGIFFSGIIAVLLT